MMSLDSKLVLGIRSCRGSKFAIGMSLCSISLSVLTLIVLVTVLAQLKHILGHECHSFTEVASKDNGKPARTLEAPMRKVEKVLLRRDDAVVPDHPKALAGVEPKTAKPMATAIPSATLEPRPSPQMKEGDRKEVILKPLVITSAKKKQHRTQTHRKTVKAPVETPLPHFDMAKTGKRLAGGPTSQRTLPQFEPESEQRMPETSIETEVELDPEIPIWLDFVASSTGDMRHTPIQSFVESV